MPPTPAEFVLPDPPVRGLFWEGSAVSGRLHVLDQTRLPREEVVLERRRCEEVEDDIRQLRVRGAPAIGVAAAYGLVLAARQILETTPAASPAEFATALGEAAEALASARPTATNLRVAVRRSLARRAANAPEPPAAPDALLAAARDLETYEVAACAVMAREGARRLTGRRHILTHCNAGALVTPGLGTALAPVYALHARGEEIHVWVDETRPLLQGSRLTAWELGRAGIACTVIVEGAAAGLFRRGRVDAVITGADRICRNGDVVNKVGTYALAVLCRHHGVPFYVAAPLTTLDPRTPDGDAVPIEERPGDACRYLEEGLLPEGGATWEPAFDVTPADLVTCLITDRGTVEDPDRARLAGLVAVAAHLQTDTTPGR